MLLVAEECMDSIQCEIIKALLKSGQRVQPRGQWIYELNGVMFKLNNPRARLIYNPKRKYNLTLALGELLWYLRGTNSLDIIQYYNQRYPQFSDDGKTLYGAYGPRIFGKKNQHSFSQWDMAYRKLREDPDSRQAIISIYSAKDIWAKTLDVPCTCYIQYFIREKKLNCIVNMRSNDIIWGTSYDVFNFTMLQEIMAKRLGLEMGWYLHFVGSVHIYDRHLHMAEEMLGCTGFRKYVMPEMPSEPEKSIQDLLKAEADLRVNGYSFQVVESNYWNDIQKVYEIYSEKKHGLPNRIDKNTIPDYYRMLL